MHTCHDIASYFLSKMDEEAGDALTNLHLQKLVYYAQGFALAVLDRPLFAEPILAWQHGPACPELFDRLKHFGNGAIPVPKQFDVSRFDRNERSLLDQVWSVYGQFAAWKLREMVWSEDCWRDTPVPEEISHDKLRRFFLTRID